MGQETPNFEEALLGECQKIYGPKWDQKQEQMRKKLIGSLSLMLEGPGVTGDEISLGVSLARIVGGTITAPVTAFLLSAMGYGIGTRIDKIDKEWAKKVCGANSCLFAVLQCDALPPKDVQSFLLSHGLGPETNDPKLEILQHRARVLLREPYKHSILWWAELFMNRVIYMLKPTALKSKGVFFKAGKNLLFNTMGSTSPVVMMMSISVYLAAKGINMTCGNLEEILTL